MSKNSKLAISAIAVVVIVVSTLTYWIRDGSVGSPNIVIPPQQLSSHDKELISEPSPVVVRPDVSSAKPVTNYQQVVARKDSKQAKNTAQASLVGWRPNIKRNISPEIAGKIAQIMKDATMLLGYDKINTLKLTRTYNVIEQDSDGSEILLETMTAYESYVQPSLVRREIYKGEYEEPLMIEVITDELVLQKKADAPVTSVNVFEDRWYNYCNHPLMLHHELNPFICEELEIRNLSAQEAITIGAEDADGHQIAILKTPRGIVADGHEFWCETWLDLENGHVLKNTMYDSDEIVVQTQNYVYKELSDGVFCPVGRKMLIYKSDGHKMVSEEKVIDIEMNTPVDKKGGLFFRHK